MRIVRAAGMLLAIAAAAACGTGSAAPATNTAKHTTAATTTALTTTHTTTKRTATAAPTTTPATTTPATTTRPPFTMADTRHAITTAIYDLGSAPLVGVAGSPSTRWWGVVSAPSDGPGPYPVAIVLHGAHAYCSVTGNERAWPCPPGNEVPNHEGLAYLTDALATRGFVAIAPGINDEFAISNDNGTRAFGAVAAAEVDRDLKALAAGSGSLGVRASEVDLTHIVMVGHSRGAALAAVLGRPTGNPKVSRVVSGLVLLAPSADSVDPTLLADVPAAVVIGTCDGDTGVDGGRFVSPSLDVKRRNKPVALIMIDRATHNATNDRLSPEAVPPGRPACAATDRLDPVVQRRTLAALVPELARATLGAAATGDGAQAFNRLRADDQVQPGTRIVHIDPTALRTSLLPKLGLPVPTAGFTPQWCPGGRYAPYRAPGTEPCHRLELEDLAGWPSGLELTWNNPGAALTVPVPASLIGSGSELVLRVLVDPADTRVGVGPVVLLLTARNGSTTSWTKDVSLVVTPVGTVDTGAYIARRGALLWSERRTPFEQAATSLTISATSPNAGSLLLVSLEVVSAPR